MGPTKERRDRGVLGRLPMDVRRARGSATDVRRTGLFDIRSGIAALSRVACSLLVGSRSGVGKPLFVQQSVLVATADFSGILARTGPVAIS